MESQSCVNIPYSQDLGQHTATFSPSSLSDITALARFGKQIAGRSSTQGLTCNRVKSGATASTLEAGKAIITGENGRPIMQLQQKATGAGGVTLQQFSTGGEVTTEHNLILLPSHITVQNSRTSLLTSTTTLKDKKAFGLVINKAVQEVYSASTIDADLQLPMLITRTVESVPSIARKRLKWSTEDEAEERTDAKRLRGGG